ncbi:hypothetical protein GCM10009646_05390 [Streptomyces aureus]
MPRTAPRRTESGTNAVKALDARAIERSKPTIFWNRLMTRNAKAGRSQNVSVLTMRSRLIPVVLPSVKIGTFVATRA